MCTTIPGYLRHRLGIIMPNYIETPTAMVEYVWRCLQMKKFFVCWFVIAVLISLFTSSTIFAQSPSGEPEPGTMEYIKWFVGSLSGFSGSTFNNTGVVTGEPEPGTMEYLEWFSSTQSHPNITIFFVSGVISHGGGSSSEQKGWFEGSPSGFGGSGF
jgi:hypothetical protein